MLGRGLAARAAAAMGSLGEEQPRAAAAVDLDAAVFADDAGHPGEADLFALHIGRRYFEAIGVRRRPGGYMVATPLGIYPPSRLLTAQRAGPFALVGPSTEVVVPLQPADDEEEPPSVRVLLLDFGDGVRSMLMDVSEAPEEPRGFHESGRLPSEPALTAEAEAWLAGETGLTGRGLAYLTAESGEPEDGADGSAGGGFESVEDGASAAAAASLRGALPGPGPLRARGPPAAVRGGGGAARGGAGPRGGGAGAAVPAAAGGGAGGGAGSSGERASAGSADPALLAILDRLEAIESRVSGQDGGLAGPMAAARPKASAASGPASVFAGNARAPIGAALAAVGPPPRVAAAAARGAVVRRGPSGTEEYLDELDVEAVDDGGRGALDGGEAAALGDAIRLQSRALQVLLAKHDDGLGLGDGGGVSATARGAAGRARLQRALLERPGYFSSTIRTNLRRRMGLSAASGSSLACPVAYLERFGTFSGHRELAQLSWLVGHAWRAMQLGEGDRAEDLLALTFAALEQAAMDNGSMEAAFMLTQLEEVPPTILERRPHRMGSSLQPFSPLWAPEWTATTLGYLRELDLLQERRAQMAQQPPRRRRGGGGDDSAQPGEDAAADDGPPRRRKPKAKAKAEA